ncbi:interferon-induced protein with tetratricopeptide repeats 1-like [Cheilinus undulatus]|uniref:interferon-induced protein with tetratricopeptide repeats 1-like n=1 Tax=Cheilinus undulatus TaxID=241271 RepID=UPI001BD408D4|nr:interferon-induced protein with tetratricopeptide repeats 1-like [Cheilinus undulatus]
MNNYTRTQTELSTVRKMPKRGKGKNKSATMSDRRFKAKLEALQCHFTWYQDPNESRLLRRKEKLEDIGTEAGNPWLGHIYNLRGFFEFKLGFTEDAQRLFQEAAETFSQIRHVDEGPWLVVNYGNMAWLHHHLGEQEESQKYLSKVDDLIRRYPSPSPGQHHPEVYAEKAWSLMKFGAVQSLNAAECFEKAISMQPDRAEWNTSYVIGLASSKKHQDIDSELLEKIKLAKEQDAENLYLAAVYLTRLAKKGEKVEDEVRELGRQILKNPVSSYSGIKPLLRVYSNHVSADEAIDLAEEALNKHPGQRYLKRCVALCYKWRIMFVREGRQRPGMIDRAISLHKEVISLYPNSSFVKKIDLANMYAKSSNEKAKCEQIYQKLLRRDLEPAEKQLLYNKFANYLHYDKKDHQGSIQFHMRAASIPAQSFYRDESIRALTRIKDTTTWNRRAQDLEQFLAKLKL